MTRDRPHNERFSACVRLSYVADNRNDDLSTDPSTAFRELPDQTTSPLVQNTSWEPECSQVFRPEPSKQAGSKRKSPSLTSDSDKINAIFQSLDSLQCISGLLRNVVTTIDVNDSIQSTVIDCITLAADEINCQVIKISSANSSHAFMKRADRAHRKIKRSKLGNLPIQSKCHQNNDPDEALKIEYDKARETLSRYNGVEISESNKENTVETTASIPEPVIVAIPPGPFYVKVLSLSNIVVIKAIDSKCPVRDQLSIGDRIISLNGNSIRSVSDLAISSDQIRIIGVIKCGQKSISKSLLSNVEVDLPPPISGNEYSPIEAI